MQGNDDIWLLDLVRDGMQIAFASNHTSVFDLYVICGRWNWNPERKP